MREQSPNKAVSTDHNKATPKTWCLTSTETIRLIRDGKATPPPPLPPPPGLALTGVTALAPLMCAHTPPLPGIDRWTVLAGWRPSTQHRHLLPHAPIHRPANKTQHARSTWWGGGGGCDLPPHCHWVYFSSSLALICLQDNDGSSYHRQLVVVPLTVYLFRECDLPALIFCSASPSGR